MDGCAGNRPFLCYNKFVKKQSKTLFDDARSYYTAAQILRDSGERYKDSQLLFAPLLYLLRHSLELLLKAYIVSSIEKFSPISVKDYELVDTNGIIVKINKKKMKVFHCHSILILFDCFTYLESQELASFFNNDKIKELRKTAVKIDAYDQKSDYFRYPLSAFGKINFRNFIKKPKTEDLDVCPDLQFNKNVYIVGEQIAYSTNHAKITDLEIELSNIISELFKNAS